MSDDNDCAKLDEQPSPGPHALAGHIADLVQRLQQLAGEFGELTRMTQDYATALGEIVGLAPGGGGELADAAVNGVMRLLGERDEARAEVRRLRGVQ